MKLRWCIVPICVFPVASFAQANDYPTFDRVEYVLQCIDENGGRTYDNLYRCVCMIDQIAARMPYADFAEATTFKQLRSTPGEQGSVFRDPERAEALPDALDQATAAAKAACLL